MELLWTSYPPLTKRFPLIISFPSFDPSFILILKRTYMYTHIHTFPFSIKLCLTLCQPSPSITGKHYSIDAVLSQSTLIRNSCIHAASHGILNAIRLVQFLLFFFFFLFFFHFSFFIFITLSLNFLFFFFRFSFLFFCFL